MIDTVRYHQVRTVTRTLSWRMAKIDETSGLRVRSKDETTVEVEVSLPKLLFGTNSKLIHTQAQITKALAKADKIVDQIAEPTTNQKNFSRVDLVWHFRSRPPQKFILSHQFSNHEEARTKFSIFKVAGKITGALWEGGKTMHIKMYDKTDNKIPAAMPVVRVEIMLRWDRLRRKLLNRQPTQELDLMTCYECYRSTLLKFHPQKAPVIRGWDDAVCYAESRGIQIFDHLSATMTPRQIRPLRRALSSFMLQHFKVDWNALLPKDRLPLKVDAGALRSPSKITIKKNTRVQFKTRT